LPAVTAKIFVILINSGIAEAAVILPGNLPKVFKKSASRLFNLIHAGNYKNRQRKIKKNQNCILFPDSAYIKSSLIFISNRTIYCPAGQTSQALHRMN
jgi:hypothetical protein